MSRQLCTYSPGEILFHEGDPIGGLYFIQSGKVEVFRSREGTEVVLGKLGPGEILGTLTVFNGEPRTASARATTRVEVQYMSSASLVSGMSKIPVWAVAIIKDTIARLKYVDGLLVESAINEKKLRGEQGSALHHGAQLAQFCALMMRLQTREDDGVQVWPAGGLAARAESVLNLRAEYLELLWDSFVAGGLAKPLDDKKWGKVIRNPRPSVFENFGVFALRAAKKGTADFLPQKLVKVAGSLVRLRQKHTDPNGLPPNVLLEGLAKDSGRPPAPDLIDMLVERGMIRLQNDLVTYEADSLQRRLVFEATCQQLLECDGTMDVRPKEAGPEGVRPSVAA